MGEKTGIQWCDHTFNPWIGCTKVSAGCEHCYAERDNNRYKWVDGWGLGQARRRTSDANWKNPLQWAIQARKEQRVHRVFCASLADVFDAEVSQDWKNQLFSIIESINQVCGYLEWLLLTKRIENVNYMMPRNWLEDPPSFIRLGVTAENQEMADYRIPKLLKVWSGKNFVSVEPMLGSVNLTRIRWAKISVDVADYRRLGVPAPDEMWSLRDALYSHPGDEYNKPLHGIDWVIAGSESGPKARPFDPDWARSLRNQCQAADIPFFLKQTPINGKLTHMPELDGRVWNQMPEVTP